MEAELMKLRVLCSLVFVLLIASLGLSRNEPSFPVYPGAEVTNVSPIFEQTIYGIFATTDDPEKVGEWYSSSLKREGWTIEEEDVGEYDDGWLIIALNGDLDVSAELNTNISDGVLTVMVKLEGGGVHPEIFEGHAPTIGRIEDGKIVDEEADASQPYVELPGEIEDYFVALDDLLRLIDAFCKQPTPESASEIVDSIEEYMFASEAAGYSLSDRAFSQDNPFAASALVSSSVIDFQIGLIGFFLETALQEPERFDDLAEQVCEMKNGLKNDQAPRMTFLARAAEELAKETENYGYWESFAPVKEMSNEFVLEVGETPPEFSTKLTVTRLFTPTNEFWASRLRETWINLRNWNAGCPDGDTPVDTDGDGWDDALDCKAFGIIPNDDPIRHCLGLPKTEEREIEFLSDPMTVYCLVSLAIEVGNYEQLLEGGELRVWINGEDAITVPLPKDGLKAASFNPWDFQVPVDLPGFPDAAGLFAEPFLNGVRLVYGEEAAEHYRAAYRFPSSVSEATGGEFNGFVYFLHIGEPIIALSDNPVESVVLLSGSEDDFVTQLSRFMDLARKNHPALEKSNKIMIQPTVGGVPGNVVEFTLPAIFSNLPEQIGTWSDWPGDRPVSDWSFGVELGENPAPDVDPKIEASPGSGMAMLEENKKYAQICMLHVLEHWVKILQDMTIEAVVKKATSTENMPTPGSDAFLKCFRETRSGGYITTVVNRLKSWYPQHASAAASEYFSKTLLNLTGEYMGKTIDVVTGKTLFQTGKEIASKIDIQQDVTFIGLTTAAKIAISHHRYLMWRMANLANIELKLWRDLDKPIAEAIGILEGIIGKEAAAVLVKPLNWFRRTVYGLDAIHHLYTIYKIQVELHQIERILMDMGSWTAM